MIAVTGFPRSGTSMMMRALQAGGAHPLVGESETERARMESSAFLIDPVGSLDQIAVWGPNNGPKWRFSVKLFYWHAARAIHGGYRLPLIVMTRAETERIRSWAREGGRPFEELDSARWGIGDRIGVHTPELYVLTHPGVPRLLLDFHTTVERPAEVMQLVADFARNHGGYRLDWEAMSMIPDLEQVHFDNRKDRANDQG